MSDVLNNNETMAAEQDTTTEKQDTTNQVQKTAPAVTVPDPNYAITGEDLFNAVHGRQLEMVLNAAAQPKNVPVINNKFKPVPGIACDYFQNDWMQDLAAFRSGANIYTGFNNLDQQQPLYPGLYTLGAISSLGKTSFVYQIADNIAEAGTPVLYFSTEQSRMELFSKSISRRINQHAMNDATYNRYTSIQIRRGEADGTRELTEQIAAYTAAVGNRMVVIECGFDMTVEDLMVMIDAYMKKTGLTPVVVVDYLQNLTPSYVNGRLITDTRVSMDHIVHALKTYQKDHNMVMITICSLNRQNYLLPVDFESFKESGGIEYTADVVWGLELAIMTEDKFERFTETYKDAKGNPKEKSRETTTSERRTMVKNEKNKDVRSVKLVVLKNRFGKSSYSLDFKYKPAYDTFEPQPAYWPGYMTSAGIGKEDYEKAQREKQEKIANASSVINED